MVNFSVQGFWFRGGKTLKAQWTVMTAAVCEIYPQYYDHHGQAHSPHSGFDVGAHSRTISFASWSCSQHEQVTFQNHRKLFCVVLPFSSFLNLSCRYCTNPNDVNSWDANCWDDTCWDDNCWNDDCWDNNDS